MKDGDCFNDCLVAAREVCAPTDTFEIDGDEYTRCTDKTSYCNKECKGDEDEDKCEEDCKDGMTKYCDVGSGGGSIFSSNAKYPFY